MIRLHKIIVLASCVVTILFGCSNKIDPSFVAERWSTTMSGFNIDPVFPPRYIQPGDIFLVMVSNGDPENDKNRYKRRSVRIGRAEVRNALMDDAKKALLLPNTSTKDPNVNIFGVPDKIVRAHSMGFTGFNIAEVEEADLGIAYPIQIFRALFGLSSRHDLAMSISVPNAEDIELPGDIALKTLRSYCAPIGKPIVCDKNNLTIQLAMKSLELPDDKPGALVPKIVIVSHVYYVRQLDYSYNTKGGTAMAANIAAAVSSSSGTGSVTLTSPSSSAPSNSTATSSSTISDAELEASTLKTQLNSIKSDLGTTGPVGSLKVLMTSSEGTVLRQTFETPVAIGYRGFWIEI